MKKIKYSFLALALFSSQIVAIAKQLPDGVEATQSFIDEIKNNYTDENSIAFDVNTPTLSVQIPIRVHIIKDMNGKTGVSVATISNTISSVNVQFKAIGIQFVIDSVHYINDYNYSYITNNHNRLELLTLYAVANKINLFLVDSIKMGTNYSYGYTYFPDAADSNVVYLNKEYASGNYLTTLLGHFMGLLSTHETLGGRELVSEKNCSESGDFICDTYADPNLYSQVDSTCTYNGSAKDSNGKYYIPTVANMMSNSSDNCKCGFTPLQYRRMYYYYLKYRQKLKY